jgi:hypothetical protein
MNAKRLFLISIAIFTASHVYALTAAEKRIGCNNEVGGCSEQGGGGDYGPSGYVGSVDRGDGSSIDFYSDSGGDWWVINGSDGNSQVGWDESAGPKMYKKMPKNPGGKRPNYKKSEMTFMAKKTLSDEQQKAAAAKAKAKAEADNKAAGVYVGPAISPSPAGAGMVMGGRKKP